MAVKRDVINGWRAAGIPRSGGPGLEREFGKGGVVQLQPFADQDYWVLSSTMRWKSSETVPTTIDVPRGFVTDFASIPQPLWSILPKIGPYGLPAILHDWLYWTQEGERSDADGLLDAASAEMNVPYWQRVAIYRSVRLFGGFAWSGNGRAKSRGEKRVLRVLPTDPKITWADWRERADVFA